ncbi:MAG: hypothetical protein IPJ69_07335 [Deltaproteobacteria bacterium]|nr:MAG: hypothetical protein IPJ69_07335 [Deltaproteobacteria bacterium]
MPPRILKDVMVIDRSALASQMYALLFTPKLRFRLRFSDEFSTLHKLSPRLRPDLLVINSNSLSKDEALNFPCPTLVISSKDRFDLKEQVIQMAESSVLLVEKPFYPYDLISLANRLINSPKTSKRGRKKKGELRV